MPLLECDAIVSVSFGFMLSAAEGAVMVPAGFIVSCGAMVPEAIGAGAILLEDMLFEDVLFEGVLDWLMPLGAMLVCASATLAPAKQIPAPRARAILKSLGIIKSLRKVQGRRIGPADGTS